MRASPPQDAHELASRLTMLLRSGKTETRKQVYNYFGIDAVSPHGRIIDPMQDKGSDADDWAISYRNKESSKSINMLIWKTGSWCIRSGDVETLLNFRFDNSVQSGFPGMATTLRHEGSVEKVSATFATNGCMTSFAGSVQ